MAYSIEASSDHCYEGTTCLINKLNIRDEEKLAEGICHRFGKGYPLGSTAHSWFF